MLEAEYVFGYKGERPMAGKRVTLAAVAKATGYTVNTISRALRDCSDIAPATRRHIQDVAGRMGYVRNMAASSLRLGRSNSIAFIAGYVVNPFFGMLFEYVSRAAAAYGWNVIFLSPNEDEPSELAAIQSAYARGVDGVVLMPTQKSDRARVLLEACRLPYVLLMRDFPGYEDDCLLCDEEQAGYAAAMHLLEKGHRRLSYVCDGGCVHNIVERRDGFLRAAKEHGVEVTVIPSLRADGQSDAVDQAEAIARLRREEGLSGVGVFCDMQARHVIAQLRRHRIRVPEDVAFVGFDNIDGVSPSPLPICSVGSDYQSMCRQVVDLLHRRIEGDSSPAQTVVFPAEINCRESCAATENGWQL